MIPFAIALPGLLLSAAIGLGLERIWSRPSVGQGWRAWPMWTLVGLSVLVTALLHPVALLALFTVHVTVAREPAPTPITPSPARAASARVEFAILAAWFLAIVLRPATPLYWDEFIWLAKSRLGPLALATAALDPTATLVPRGYPILASLAHTLLSLGRQDLPSLTAGPAALMGLSMAAVLALLPERRTIPWSVAMLAAPLVWIHLRSAHLDLVVGLLALVIALALSAPRERRAGGTHVAVSTAFFLAGTKDEGVVHVLAICIAHVISSASRRDALRAAAPVAGAAITSVVLFRGLLWMHGVTNDDHAVGFAGIAHVREIGLELARAATDLASFGLAWPITFGTAIAVAARRLPRSQGPALGLLLQGLLLTAGLVLGTERLVEFTLSGTVAARLLIQLTPMAAWFACEAWVELSHDDGAIDEISHAPRTPHTAATPGSR